MQRVDLDARTDRSLTDRCFHRFEYGCRFAAVHGDRFEFIFSIGAELLAVLHQMHNACVRVVVGHDSNELGKMIPVPFSARQRQVMSPSIEQREHYRMRMENVLMSLSS